MKFRVPCSFYFVMRKEIQMNEIQMFVNYPDVVTIEQLQEMLCIGRNTAYRLINEKYIRSIRIGNVHKIPKIYVIEYILANAS